MGEESKQQDALQEHPHHAHSHDHSKEGIQITRHEEALIGSLRGRLPAADLQTAQRLAAEQMRIIGQRVTEQGGIIGHLKFIVSSPGKCCQLSLTDTAETIRYFDSGSCRIEGVAIVFLIAEEELQKILQETLGRILEP